MERIINDHFLFLLFQNKHEEAIECLTPENANERDSNDRGVLESFVLYGPDGPNGVAMLHRLLSKGVKLNRVEPLNFAAARQKVDLVRALLDWRAPIGHNVISWAVFGFEREEERKKSDICVKMLIDAGATPSHIISMPFYESRLLAREAAIAILCLQTQKRGGGAKDALRIIARCVWGTRGHDEWIHLCNNKQRFKRHNNEPEAVVTFLKRNWFTVACVCAFTMCGFFLREPK